MLVALLQRVKNEDGEGSDDSNDEEMESGTGLPSTETFNFLFGYLSKKAQSCNIGDVESRQLKNHLNPLLLSR